jgi:ribosomal protein S1
MIAPGEIINAEVDKVESYGVFLSARGHALLVLIPEVSWNPGVRDCRNFAEPGQRFDVKVIRYVEDEDVYWASIKAVHPESDPWYSTDWLEVGVVRTAQVRGSVFDNARRAVGCYVELEPGIKGLMRVPAARLNLMDGDSVLVRVTKVDKESHRVEVEALQRVNTSK